MARTSKDIKLPEGHEGVLEFVQDWFDKKNFDLLARNDEYLRMERIRFGWICFEFWVFEGEQGPYLHFEACVKGLFKPDDHEFEWEIENNTTLAQRWPLKKGNEYLAEFIPDLHAFLNGQVVHKEYEDTKYQKEFNQVIPPGGTIWRWNTLVKLGVPFSFAMMVTILASRWIPGLPQFFEETCFFTVAVVSIIFAILFIGFTPLKIGFSNEFIIIKLAWRKYLIYWDAIVDHNGYPLLLLGEKGMKKNYLYIHMYDAPPFRLPPISIEITHEIQSRYVKRRRELQLGTKITMPEEGQ